eukprot:31044-Pelagococcus_subviridis.AAC.4
MCPRSIAHFSAKHDRGRGIWCTRPRVRASEKNSAKPNETKNGSTRKRRREAAAARAPLAYHEVLRVQDVVREQIVRQHRGLPDGRRLARDRLGRLRDVPDLERGNARRRLGRVRRLLQRLQLLRLRDDPLDVLRGQTGAVLRDPRLLVRLLLRRERRVRVQLHGHLVRVVDQQFLQQRLEDVARGHLRLEVRERALEPKRLERILLVQPRAQRPQHERQTAREPPGVVLAHAELDRVHGGVDRLSREPLLRDLRDRGLDQRLHLGNVLFRDALETDRERRLTKLVLETPTHDGLAEAGLLQRHSQRRRGGAEEKVIEEADGEPGLDVERAVVQEPVHLHERLLLLLALARDVRLDDAPRFREERLRGDGGVDVFLVELVEEIVQELQAVGDVVVAVEPHPRVARVVKLPVELLKLLEAQIRNDARVAAAVHAVRVIREQRLLARRREHRIRGRVHALHLVEHDALELRVEHRVEVHVHKVLEVLKVTAGDRVARAIGVRHRVQERVQRPLDELHERLLDRVLPRAAQHGVLQDVRDPRAVLRRGPERHAETLVLVVVRERHDLRARLEMLEQERLRVVLRDVLLADELEAVEVRAGRRREVRGRDLRRDRAAVQRTDRRGRADADAASSGRRGGDAARRERAVRRRGRATRDRRGGHARAGRRHRAMEDRRTRRRIDNLERRIDDEIDAREEPRFGVGSERRRRATSVGRDRAMKRATKRRRDSRVR